MSIKLDGNTFLTGPDLSAGGYSGTKLILHGWFRAGDDTPIQGYLVRESGGAVGHLWLRQETSGNLVFQCETSGGAVIATLNSGSAYQIADGWLNFDIVVDTVAGFAKMYINGVQKASVTPSASAVIDLAGAGWNLGSRYDGNNKFTGDLDQIYLSNSFTTAYISATGELTAAKYLMEMYDFDQNGVMYRKSDSIATAVSVPFVLLEKKVYSSFLTNNGSSATDWLLGSGDLLPTSDDDHTGTWTFTG